MSSFGQGPHGAEASGAGSARRGGSYLPKVIERCNLPAPGVGDGEYTHQFEVWTGVSYCAANLYRWGKRIGDGSLQADALPASWGVYYETWANEHHAYCFSTPEAWRLEDPRKCRAAVYQRARGI